MKGWVSSNTDDVHSFPFSLIYRGGPHPKNWHKKRGRTFVRPLAVRTGLEPVTPCVTGMYSNQLNYRTFNNRFLSIAVQR